MALIIILLLTTLALALPNERQLESLKSGPYDVQGHRGGRGDTIENTIPSFAWGLIHGATTLELDTGITQDGTVVVWHDENIDPTKCVDTAPAFPGDSSYPYVGKFIANLTLAQIKTLDCGSQRLAGFPLQLVYPGTRISTLQEVFDFAKCADPERRILWNIESKIDPAFPNRTRGVTDFVTKLHKLFVSGPYRNSITFQSFDWRTLVAMKALDSRVITSALIDHTTATTPSVWLAGLNLASFPGKTIGEQVAEAAAAIHANVVSPEDVFQVSHCPTDQYQPFLDQSMIQRAHELGQTVKTWTVDSLDRVDQLLKWGVDGIISDYPDTVRRRVQQYGYPVAKKYPEERVLRCLALHNGST